MQLPPGPVRVMDVVGDDDRKTHLLGQARCFGDQPGVIRQEMVFEREEETGRGHPPGPSLCACVRPPEQRGESLGYHPTTLTISSPETSDDRAVAPRREGDDTRVALADGSVAEPWL